MLLIVVVWRYHSSKDADCFSSLAACISPSPTMKVSPQGGRFWVRYNWIPPNIVSDVYDIFNNKDLPSNSERQPRAKAIACNVLGDAWTALEGGLLYMLLWLLLDSHSFLG